MLSKLNKKIKVTENLRKTFIENKIGLSHGVGNNGTIDGLGSSWWKKFKKGARKVTRPYVIEIMYSDQI